MSGRWWLLREQILNVLTDAPAPTATWTSVVRRAAIVLAFFAIGLATGHMAVAALGAFGALQLGLLEAAVPLRSLLRLLVGLTIGSVVAVFIGMVVGDSWLAVVYIAVFAYVFGCVAALGPAFMTIGISSLALAVIFAGMPATPQQALLNAGWVAIGAIVQSIGWLLAWKPERRSFVRRALATKLRADIRMVRGSTLDARSLIRALNTSVEVSSVLRTAEFDAIEERRLRNVFSRSIDLTRALIAWIVVRAPGAADRITVGMQIEVDARRIDDFPLWATTTPPEQLTATGVTSRAVNHALEALAGSIEVERSQTAPVDVELARPARPTPSRPHVRMQQFWSALRPGSTASRHGLRMMLGLGIAELLSVVLPIDHSFWLPLTVVFTLKPDWSFTLVRGFNRTVGNLAAVVFVPIVLTILGGVEWLWAIPLFVLAAAMYRWFFGNYMIASLGLAGTVLILDQTLNPDRSMFVIRIVAAVAGALLALAVSLLVPSWTSKDAPKQVRRLIDELGTLGATVRSRSGHSAKVDDRIDEQISNARVALLALEPTASGALLEPHRHGGATELAMVLATGSRLFMHVVANAYFVIAAEREGDDQVVEGPAIEMSHIRWDQAQRDFDEAIARYAAIVPV